MEDDGNMECSTQLELTMAGGNFVIEIVRQ